MKDPGAPHHSQARGGPLHRGRFSGLRSGRSIGLAAVLFDMDGTLVETEHYWDIGLEELAVRLGGRLSAESRPAMTGVSVPRALELLYADLGLQRSAADQAADDRWLQESVVQKLVQAVDWRPGARTLLATVRAAGLPTALVTTTHRPLASIVLGHLTRDSDGDPFDVTVTGDEVPAVKPDPAPYRQAMAALGVNPAGCVVVEDSLVGVAAGLAAGAAVLGVPALQELPPAPGLTVRSTLEGVGIAELREVLAARDDELAPAPS